MNYLSRRGWRCITPGALAAHYRGEKEADSKSILITFDDGSRSCYREAFPVLRSLGMTATVFIVSGQLGGWNWQRWANPEFDRLDKVASSTLDTAERAKALVRMQELMEDSAAFVWLTHDVLNFATRSWLKPAVLPNGNDWQLDDFREA
jgi:ABC-type transport system substrate-binding protein